MAEKKVKGRKRHIGVDSQGHLLWVDVTAANVHDTNAGVYLMDGIKMKHESIQAFSADGGYRGNASWYADILLETPVQIPQKLTGAFRVQPIRWIVERTFAWLSNSRRLSKDYAINPTLSEHMIRIAMMRITLRQLIANP